MEEPRPDPVPEGGEPGQQAVLQTGGEVVAVVPGEHVPAHCGEQVGGSTKNWVKNLLF